MIIIIIFVRAFLCRAALTDLHFSTQTLTNHPTHHQRRSSFFPQDNNFPNQIMKTSHYNGTPASSPTDFTCKYRFDNHRSDSVFKKPRFSEENYILRPKVPLSVNRTKLSIPFKSEMCNLFQRGKCYHGQNCHFAHSVSEINNPMFKPVAMKELCVNVGEEDNSKFNTNKSSYFSRGRDCPRFVQKFDRETNNKYMGSWARNDCGNRWVYRKTKLCRRWEVCGMCPYGVKCFYAHGNAELQEPNYSLRHKVVLSSDEVESKIAQKLQLKQRSYFATWDIEKISRIYADD